MVKYVKSDLQFTSPETHVRFYSVKLQSPILTYFTMLYLFNHFIVQYSPLCITYIEPFRARATQISHYDCNYDYDCDCDYDYDYICDYVCD